MRIDGENNYRRVVLSNSGQGDTDVGKPVSICLDPVNGWVESIAWISTRKKSVCDAIFRAQNQILFS